MDSGIQPSNNWGCVNVSCKKYILAVHFYQTGQDLNEFQRKPLTKLLSRSEISVHETIFVVNLTGRFVTEHDISYILEHRISTSTDAMKVQARVYFC